jgi:hypothetical protein
MGLFNLKCFFNRKRGAVWPAPLLVVFLLTNLLTVLPVQAQGGLAISGSFYRQNFEIPQGSSINSPEVYVVVFNNGETSLGIKMAFETPVGIKIKLSQSEFTLPPGGQQQVLVGVEVTKDVASGEYELTVTAQSYQKAGTGIQISGAASQSAKLTVLGTSGTVKIQAVSPDGQPLVAAIRLYKTIAGQSSAIAYSETGTLETKVAPGNFTSAVYVGGEKQAEQSFSVAQDENKIITLSAATIYFEGFNFVPNYEKATGKLAFAQIVYTVKNLYKPVTHAEVVLEVNHEGQKLEDISLVNLSPLEMGNVGLNYNYIPSSGWVKGAYSFKLSLQIDGKPYTASQEQTLNVSGSFTREGGLNPLVIGGILAGVLLIAGAGVLAWRRKRI